MNPRGPLGAKFEPQVFTGDQKRALNIKTFLFYMLRVTNFLISALVVIFDEKKS